MESFLLWAAIHKRRRWSARCPEPCSTTGCLASQIALALPGDGHCAAKVCRACGSMLAAPGHRPCSGARCISCHTVIVADLQFVKRRCLAKTFARRRIRDSTVNGMLNQAPVTKTTVACASRRRKDFETQRSHVLSICAIEPAVCDMIVPQVS
jgi:hypothetical protein